LPALTEPTPLLLQWLYGTATELADHYFAVRADHREGMRFWQRGLEDENMRFHRRFTAERYNRLEANRLYLRGVAQCLMPATMVATMAVVNCHDLPDQDQEQAEREWRVLAAEAMKRLRELAVEGNPPPGGKAPPTRRETTKEQPWPDARVGVGGTQQGRTSKMKLQAPKKRFDFKPGQALFDGKDLGLPSGSPVTVLEKLVQSWGETVQHRALHDQSTQSEASPELREAVRVIRKAFRHHRIRCKLVSKRGEGYLIQ
jgi:hypothetical protein